jgi:hypothetical protein
MEPVGTGLTYIAGLVQLICLILVLVKMFQHGQTGLGIACILLSCCGIGVLITFIYGWVKSREWGITNIMVIWSVAWIIGIVGGVMNPNAIPYKIPQNP